MCDRDMILNLMRSKLKYYNNNILKEDYIMFTTTRRMINSFINKGKINENLIFNNIIILYNKYDSTSYDIFKILLTEEKISILNPFYIFLGILDKEDLKLNYYIVEIIKNFAIQYHIIDHSLKNY